MGTLTDVTLMASIKLQACLSASEALTNDRLLHVQIQLLLAFSLLLICIFICLYAAIMLAVGT